MTALDDMRTTVSVDMMNNPMHTVIEQVELVEGEMISAHEVARICRVSVEWVHARIQSDILQADWRGDDCYVSGHTLWRAREIAAIEAQYEADPQLAALVADLAEEVRRLRGRLALYEG